MRTCSNASFGALLDNGRTIMMVGLGDMEATLDIDTFAWTKSKDPREEAGRENASRNTRERGNVKTSGEQPVPWLPFSR